MAAPFTPTPRTRLKRLHERGHYDRETVHAILDAGVICHVGYVIDGQPYVTPTSYWRHGDLLYWHGSSASRMLRHLRQEVPVCVEVTHFDGFVLARSGFHHSINYRSVMVFGRAAQGRRRRLCPADLGRRAPRGQPDRRAAARPPSRPGCAPAARSGGVARRIAQCSPDRPVMHCPAGDASRKLSVRTDQRHALAGCSGSSPVGVRSALNLPATAANERRRTGRVRSPPI